MNYEQFIEEKSQIGKNMGFKPHVLPDFLFPFQKHLTEWAIVKGRAAVLANCGLGKTPMQLVWSQNVVQETNVGRGGFGKDKSWHVTQVPPVGGLSHLTLTRYKRFSDARHAVSLVAH